MRGTRAGVAVTAALAPAAWGTTYLVTTELLPEGRPLLLAALRALPAGLLLLLIGRKLPKGRWWGRAAVLGMLNIGLFFPLTFVGAYRLPGGVAATIGAIQPCSSPGSRSACSAYGQDDGRCSRDSPGSAASPCWC